MASTFKNFQAAATTSAAVVYTAPAGKSSVVTYLNVANEGTANADITIWLRDSSAAVDAPIGKAITVPVGAAINFVSDGAKLVLETGDAIVVQGSAATSLRVVGSVAEMG